jgi:glutamyl-tRNA reductase
MPKIVLCVGLSHKQAPIAIREQVAVPSDQLLARLARLRGIAGVREAVLLSTCNRLEIFAAADGAGVGDDLLRELGAQAAPHAIVRRGEEALRHLFRVAASLDSMVVGEAQILGQVKDAAAQAQAAGTVGPLLSRAVGRALAAAKRVRSETGIARGALSLSSVAVGLARKVLGDLRGRSVLLIGAGEMAQLAARELKTEGAHEVLVANRGALRADALAREVGGVSVSMEELPALLERADVAICSTAAAAPVITHALMTGAARARRFRPMFLIDLALPRNVEPAVNQLENVYVYDLDDLERVASQNRGLREGELSRAEAIVEEELLELLRDQRERTAVPVLARLHAHAQKVAEAEVGRTLSQLGPVSERQQKTVRAMAAAIVNKLLHGPTARLRGEAGQGPLAQAVAQLFDLGDELPDGPAHADASAEAREESPGQAPAGKEPLAEESPAEEPLAEEPLREEPGEGHERTPGEVRKPSRAEGS